MTPTRPTLRFLLDEGAPDSVGRALMEAGHNVAFLNKTPARGSADQVVCAIADVNDAILVAVDGDMKRLAKANGISGRQYIKVGLLKLSCDEPDAADRVRAAMSLIEHEWMVSEGKEGRRIFVEIGRDVIRSFR